MQEINRDIGPEPRLEWVDVAAIRIDENYQRKLKPSRVRQILKDFNWAHFGPILLAEHDDGTFTVYDGQHRVEAARRHPDIEAVPAMIVQLEQAFEEAQAFLGVNVNRTAITTVEKYWAGIEAGDPAMMAVCAVLEAAGCDVVPAATKSAAPGLTSSVSAVDRAIKRYGDQAVTDACLTLREAWPKDAHALNGSLIQALARIYRNNRRTIDRDRMVQKLISKDRKILTSDAEAMRKISGGDAVAALSKTLVEIYNRGISLNLIELGKAT